MPVAHLPAVDLNYLQLPCEKESTVVCNDLVLIHGMGASLAFWHLGIAKALSKVCRVTAYDLRGHGRSAMPPTGYSVAQMVDDLEKLLNHLQIDRAHLAAHSFGGNIAVSFALKYPERVASLILADVRLRAIQPKQRLRDWEHWPKWQQKLQRAGIKLDENDPEGGYQMLIEMARLQIHHPKLAQHLPRLFSMGAGGKRKGGVARRWLRLQEETSVQQDFSTGDPMEREQLRQLTMPILALYGEFSPTLPTARALQELCPNIYMYVIKKAGHFFPLNHPKLLARVFAYFIKTQKHPRPKLLENLGET